MPQIGDIVSAKQAGKNHGGRYIWLPCSICEIPRWMRLSDHRRGQRTACRNCHNRAISKAYWGDLHFKERGTNNHGYKEISLKDDHAYASMRNKAGFVMEHRLVMAEHLNRPLMRNEHVHHRNGDRADNRLENLELISPAKHGRLTRFCNDCELRKEIRLLRWQVKELTSALQTRLQVGGEYEPIRAL